MQNGDPAVFGLPCRFPAAPSIRSENRVQHIDLKNFAVQGEPRKKFPEFSRAAGNRRGGVTSAPF
jgi:hypothetical protein